MFTSRKFIGTVILTVLRIAQASFGAGTLVIPDDVMLLWGAWMAVEGAVDVTRTIRQSPRPAPPPGAPEA